MALAQAILGHGSAAGHAMGVALAAAPGDRFVLRSAARLAIHRDDPERAHDLLARSPRTRVDPWLVAAEIASAAVAKRTPVLAKAGRAMLASNRFSPLDLSELSGALGTQELIAGSTKIARKHFKNSLAAPSENAIAQGRWAGARLHEFSPFLAPHLKNSPEARAWAYSGGAQWELAVKASWLWLDLEPFSARPCVHGSYVASVALRDFDEGERLARAGLSANPGDFTLQNNLVFSLACAGRIVDAQKAFDSINAIGLDDEKRAVWTATQGLLAFRTNSPESGRLHYLAAIDLARTQDPRLLALAWLFFAEEELRSGASTALETLRRALQHSDAASLRAAKEIVEFRLRLMAKLPT